MSCSQKQTAEGFSARDQDDASPHDAFAPEERGGEGWSEENARVGPTEAWGAPAGGMVQPGDGSERRSILSQAGAVMATRGSEGSL